MYKKKYVSSLSINYCYYCSGLRKYYPENVNRCVFTEHSSGFVCQPYCVCAFFVGKHGKQEFN